jgi:hypothetical protein
LGQVELNSLTERVIGTAIEVHRHLGPGLEIFLDQGYRLDLLVEHEIIVELKVVEQLTSVHVAQILSYLKFSGCKIGLLINFNVKLLKDGIRRFIMN